MYEINALVEEFAELVTYKGPGKVLGCGVESKFGPFDIWTLRRNYSQKEMILLVA